jgi:hypothetical protein
VDSSLPLRFGPSSRQIARGLALAFVAFALGSALGYGFGVYGPRWWPAMAEWSHLAQNIMNRNGHTGFASDLTIDHRAPVAERDVVTTPKGPAENENVDDWIAEDHLAALMTECDRRIAQHRWGNALETYLRMVNEFPGSPAAAQLGVRLSAILWSEVTGAARGQRLDEARMLFDMLTLLPPVPAEAILANDLGEGSPWSSTPDDTAGSASLIDPPHTGSNVRPEVTSARPSEASDDSRGFAAAAGIASATRLAVRPLPSSAQVAASDEARLRLEFEQFLNERQQAPRSPRDRETLFAEFKNSLPNGLVATSAPTSADKEGTRRVETWQALETTNLRKLASAESTVVGTVAKGSTFRAIGRSEDGKWLKIETRDGLTGYYWAARARETR